MPTPGSGQRRRRGHVKQLAANRRRERAAMRVHSDRVNDGEWYEQEEEGEREPFEARDEV